MSTKKIYASGNGLVDRCLKMVNDWWLAIVYAMLAVAFVVFVIMPWFSLSEARLKDGARLMSSQELTAIVGQIEKDLNVVSNSSDSPAEVKMRHARIMRRYRTLDVQCRALFEVNPTMASGYAMSIKDLPCTKFSIGELRHDFDKYTMQFRQGVEEDLKMGTEAYHLDAIHLAQQEDEARRLAGANLTETIYHPEVMAESLYKSILLAMLFFIVRLYTSGSYVICEVFSGRLLIKALFWPITICSYPDTDIIKQVQEMKRWLGYVLSFFISLLSANIVKAASKDEMWGIAGGGSVQSSYVLNSNKQPTPYPVVQPWAKVTYGTPDASMYVKLWSSIGLQKSNQGDELDFAAGYVFTPVNGVSLDTSFNYFSFLATRTGLYVPKMVVCANEYGLCGTFQYMVPDTPDKSGMQFGFTWTHVWERFLRLKTMVGTFHLRDTYGAKPITVVRGEVLLPLGESGLSIFTGIYTPLRHDPGDVTHVVGGITFAF